MAGNPVLVTSLGAPPKLDEVDYCWGDRRTTASCRTRFVPLALCHLLHPKPQRVIVLLTDEARNKYWDDFRREMAEVGAPDPEAVPIPSGENEQEFWEVFQRLANALEEVQEVYLDITFSFRYLSFLYYAALAYLTGFRNLRLRGVYYGRREDGRIVDVTPLVTLTEGYHAVRAFREAGNLQPVVQILRRQARASGRMTGELKEALDALERATLPLAAGLPLDAGVRLRIAFRQIERLEARGGDVQLAGFRHLLELLRAELKDFELPPDAPDAKARIPLTPDELQRELKIITWYREKGRLETALLLLREWVINRVLLTKGQRQNWLNYDKVRKHVENALGSPSAPSHRHRADTAQVLRTTGEPQGTVDLVPGTDRPSGAAPSENSTASDIPQSVGELWHRLRQERNLFAHAGFTASETNLAQVEKALSEALTCIDQHGDDNSFWLLDIGPEDSGEAGKDLPHTDPEGPEGQGGMALDRPAQREQGVDAPAVRGPAAVGGTGRAAGSGPAVTSPDTPSHSGSAPAQARALANIAGAVITPTTREVAATGEGGQRGPLLITPSGLSPGVLFTAVHRLLPAQVIVITSDQGIRLAAEALQRAGYSGPWEAVLVSDPHTCFQELPTVLTAVETVLRCVPPDTPIVVNFTGGTTAIQYLVSRLEESLRAGNRPLRRVALVDRRPPEQQREDPYHVGEVVDLP